MKKVCIIFLLSIIISLTVFGGTGVFSTTRQNAVGTQSAGEYLRIHIRADSNDGAAQAVKYYVRDEVVKYLTPVVADCESKAKALQEVGKELFEIEKVATAVLREKGYVYGASAELCTEYFPTRVYANYTLPAGEYTALILRLGRGEGDNWWCVVYPPLCFSAPTGENVIYKSKIKEIIQKFYQE